MESLSIKSKLIQIGKKLVQYAFIVGALIIGFCIGKLEHKISEANKVEQTVNPFNQLHTDKDISIAVDEHNKLLLINVNTGTYQVYSDSIGMSIFKLYSNRLYQSAHE